MLKTQSVRKKLVLGIIILFMLLIGANMGYLSICLFKICSRRGKQEYSVSYATD